MFKIKGVDPNIIYVLYHILLSCKIACFGGTGKVHFKLHVN